MEKHTEIKKVVIDGLPEGYEELMASIPEDERPRIVFSIENCRSFFETLKEKLKLDQEAVATINALEVELTAGMSLEGTTQALKRLDNFIKNKLTSE